jgi:hypothetical protein
VPAGGLLFVSDDLFLAHYGQSFACFFIDSIGKFEQLISAIDLTMNGL